MSLVLVGSSSQSLRVDDAAVLSLPDGDWSLGGWVKIAANSGTGRYTAFGWGGWASSPSINFCFHQASHSTSPNKLYCYSKDAGGDTVAPLSTGTPGASSAWQHILAVRSGNTVTQYVDGVADGSATNANYDDINVAFYAYLGQTKDGNYYFTGKLAEWAKWNSALSSGQIASIVAGAKPGDVGTPAWWLPMRDDKESDAGSLTTVLVNTPSFDADDHPVVYSVALEFDPLAVGVVSPLGVINGDVTLAVDPVAAAAIAKEPWILSRVKYPRQASNSTIVAGGGI